MLRLQLCPRGVYFELRVNFLRFFKKCHFLMGQVLIVLIISISQFNILNQK